MIAAFVFGSLFALIAFTRLPLGFVMMVTGAAGIAALHPRGWSAALGVAEQQIVGLAMNYQFSVLPLFILMGVFVVRSGLAEELFDAARCWIGHLRGGVGMAAILACGGFSAMSASSSAAAATMAKIALPELEKARYDNGFSAGSIAAGGTMGILIPPSGALIIYGLLVEENVGALFLAGLIPGLIQLLFYVLVMLAVGMLFPDWAPSGRRMDWSARMRALSRVWGVMLLFGLIMVGLVEGWFTATEAGGIGAGCAFLFALGRGRMSWRVLIDSLGEAARLSTMIFIVAAGALVLNQFINLSGVPGAVVRFIEGLGLQPFAVLLLLILFYLVLGCLMDGFAMIFLTVPIVAPVIAEMGYDLIWWGIVTVIVVEISLITPPVGLNVFILKAMLPRLPITQIFKGITPYLVADVARLTLLLLFPALALWLPHATGH
ncbi:TRAP transporter, DctM subunit [Rubellimicrobium thermophilum DSM 16684]|uniref:TRAP transporter large permease protein n=1 Tax=Rubellimicrobium thermophilum DSM 16684 TaxID=1123069 RepID=S9QTD4_9RHOB|nr:TRAP transporter large permease [Rubellimicrobium thermophilum]EPX82897.1 TRAP transporter, DctM subunit [Rubellimicrobium thermophilum DSM 16684]